MTGLLTQAAATEHLNELRAAAGNRGLRSREQRQRRPRAFALRRQRRALVA
ncbi:MAG TPA: hypothetical protein VHR40_09890 [Thermoleophilaceae bacterium]|nr:hypothetical protein [Thermoleophilaceae bacterium]